MFSPHIVLLEGFSDPNTTSLDPIHFCDHGKQTEFAESTSYLKQKNSNFFFYCSREVILVLKVVKRSVFTLQSDKLSV